MDGGNWDDYDTQVSAIYRINLPSGIYIGATVLPLDTRLRQHISRARSNVYRFCRMSLAIKRDCERNLVITQVASVRGWDNRHDVERDLIAEAHRAVAGTTVSCLNGVGGPHFWTVRGRRPPDHVESERCAGCGAGPFRFGSWNQRMAASGIVCSACAKLNVSRKSEWR